MSKIIKAFLCVLGALLFFGITAANAAVVPVTNTDTAGWFEMDQAGSATGSITTTKPHGVGNTGSLEYTTSGSAADIINAGRVPLVRMNEITAVGYDFYSTHGTFAPSLKLQYWNLQRFGTLVYEPTYNGAYSTSTWIDGVDATAGLWWSTEGPFVLKTFSEWQAELGDISVTFFQVGVGAGWNAAMTGYADMVTLNGTTWDFEGTAVLPPEFLVDIVMDKVLDTAGPYAVGDTIQYTMTVSNAGPDMATNIQVDDVPTNLMISSVSSANCSAFPCMIPTLAVSQAEVITVMATILRAGAFDNVAGALADEEDTNYTNNVDSVGNGGTAAATPVPVMSVWGLGILAGLLGLMGFVRRRKA